MEKIMTPEEVEREKDLALEVGCAILLDGGTVTLSLLLVRHEWVKKRLGDKKLLEFIKRHEQVFEVVKNSVEWEVTTHPGIKDTTHGTGSSGEQQAKQLLNMIEKCVSGKGDVKLAHLTSRSNIANLLHSYTRVTGCCREDVPFTPSWWEAATGHLLTLIEKDSRFTIVPDVSLRATAVRAHSDDLYTPPIPPLESRLNYLLVQKGTRSPLGRTLPVSKICGDAKIRDLLGGCKVSTILGLLDKAAFVVDDKGSGNCCVTLKHADPKPGTSKDSMPTPPPPPVTILDHREGYVVVAKPSGWSTECVVAEVYKICGCEEGVDTVSRLDKGTSGVLVVPLTKEAEGWLGDAFRERSVTKTYHALVCGTVEEPEQTISEKLKLLDTPTEFRSVVHHTGKPAETHVRLVATYQKGNGTYSLVAATPKTGRTHQIRAHLAHIGHPIVSDTKYAGPKRAKRHQKWCKRLFLHASELSFQHGDETITVGCPLSDNIKSVLDHL
eukprot:TRINITY_DN12694_c0_g1_i2.p1 TRINITY_DN12694_c0_g1~~TRINITY_DN12694_c0_g1_i2.p1  ORF type:complete len:496 (+),score=91.41 TRINITY_DN12694_c0_g1_i2:58-1545(+)